MLLEVLLLGATELHTIFKKSSSLNCATMPSDIAAITESLKHVYPYSWPFISLLLLTLLSAVIMHMCRKSILMIRFLLLLPHYRYSGISASLFNHILILPCLNAVNPCCLNLLQETSGTISFEFVVWEFTYKHNSCCHRNWSIMLYHLFCHKNVTNL